MVACRSNVKASEESLGQVFCSQHSLTVNRGKQLNSHDPVANEVPYKMGCGIMKYLKRKLGYR